MAPPARSAWALLLAIAAAGWLVPGVQSAIEQLDCSGTVVSAQFVATGPPASFSATGATSNITVTGVFGMIGGWAVELSVERDPIGYVQIELLPPGAAAGSGWQLFVGDGTDLGRSGLSAYVPVNSPGTRFYSRFCAANINGLNPAPTQQGSDRDQNCPCNLELGYCTCAPFSGAYVPFNAGPDMPDVADGTWRLRIVDTGSSGGGTLNWWTLSLFTATSGAFCSGNPSPITSNDASWPASCSGGGPTRPGAGCNAACSAGFIGPGYRATCTAGAWGSPFAIEQGCTRGCSGNPSISITNQAAWNCGSGTDAGSNCTAPCSAGYVGSATASCSATGTWSPPVGTCTPAPCGGAVTTLANQLPWACTSIASGSNCTASCAPGYIGSVWATCSFGILSFPAGGCSPRACSGNPSSSIANQAAWSCGNSTASGGNCTAPCEAGFTGSATATCSLGNFSTPAGSCVQSCVGQPNITVAGQTAWACGSSTASGRNCSAPCRSGYAPGSVTATCLSGVWTSVEGTCTGVDECTGNPQPDLIPGAAWDCLRTAHGGTCTATCRTGAPTMSQGAPVAQCDAGDWRYVRGSCGGSNMYFFAIEGPSYAVAQWEAFMRSRDGAALANGILKKFFWEDDKKVTHAVVVAPPARRRRRLLAAGTSQLLVGFQVDNSPLLFPPEAVFSRLLRTPAVVSLVASELTKGMAERNIPPGFDYGQATLAMTDSVGIPLTPAVQGGDCGIDPSPVVRATTQVCYGTSSVSASFSFKANKGVSNVSFVEEPNPAEYAGLACRHTSDFFASGSQLSSAFRMECTRQDGTPFLPGHLRLPLRADYTCNNAPAFVEVAAEYEVVAPTVELGTVQAPSPACAGTGTVTGIFSFKVAGLIDAASTQLAATASLAGRACTVALKKASSVSGTVAVTCNGGTTASVGSSLPLVINVTASPRGVCLPASGKLSLDVPVLCCKSAGSYAKASGATCFQHTRPGTAINRCRGASRNWGFINTGPGSATIFLDGADACRESVEVGRASLACSDSDPRALTFTLSTRDNTTTLTDRLYLLKCGSVSSSTACPGERWSSVESARPSVAVDGTTTFAVRLSRAACTCATVKWGVYLAGTFRGTAAGLCA